MTIPGKYIECPSCHRYNHPSANCPCGHAKGKSKDEPSLEQVFDSAIDVSSERELQGETYNWLSQNGAVAIIWHAMNKPTTCFSGVSDFVFLFRKTFVAAEAKCGANKATEAQQKYIDDVNANGGVGFVFRSVEELKARLSELSL